MSERIAVGDLVQVVGSTLCCGSAALVGRVFFVGTIQPIKTAFCATCGVRINGENIAWQIGNDYSAYVKCLKRIPPLEELERETRKEEIEA